MESRCSPGGGKRGGPSRKAAPKAADEDEDDGASRSSDSPANCFGFVAYSVNSGERARAKVKTSGPWSERPASPAPSPRKLRCLDQRDAEPAGRERGVRAGGLRAAPHLPWPDLPRLG